MVNPGWNIGTSTRQRAVKMPMRREEMVGGTKSLLGIGSAFDIWSKQDEERRASVRYGLSLLYFTRYLLIQLEHGLNNFICATPHEYPMIATVISIREDTLHSQACGAIPLRILSNSHQSMQALLSKFMAWPAF